MDGIKENFNSRKIFAKFQKWHFIYLEKIKSPKNILRWDEDDAIEWQMLLLLFTNNNLMVPNKVLVYGMLACHYLLGEHSSDFDEPSKRRAVIRRFMKKVDSEFCSVKACKDIAHFVKQK